MIRKASKADLPQVLKLVCAYHEYEDIKLSDRQRETSVRSLINDRRLEESGWFIPTTYRLDTLPCVSVTASNFPDAKPPLMNST